MVAKTRPKKGLVFCLVCYNRVMVNKNRVILGVVGALTISFGIFCSNVLAENPQESEFSVTIAPSATLTVPSAPINLIVEPTAEGQFASGSFNITAYTNSPEGFTVTMATSSTALVSDTVSVTTGDPYTIPSLAASTTQANFTPNRWGISLDGGTTYIPMPSSDTIIDEDEETGASGYTQAIGYATKLDFGTVPGTYSTTINFTATANIVEPFPDPGSINDSSPSGTGNNFPANSLLRAFEIAYIRAEKPMYVATNDTTHYPTGWKPMEDGDTGDVRFAMQDIDLTFTEEVAGVSTTQNVCQWAAPSWANFNYASSANPTYFEMSTNYIDTALVMDVRDGKSYWITKHADGKCWMSQNLDFDYAAGQPLNSDTTALYQINDGFNLYTTNNGYSSTTVDGKTTIYWTPTGSTISVDANGKTIAPSGYGYSTPFSTDPGVWYWKNTPWYAAQSSWSSEPFPYGSAAFLDKFSATSLDPLDNRNGTQTAIGNYYKWGAAAATNSGDIDQTVYDTSSNLANNPQNSICPKGWRLPKVNDVASIGDEDSGTQAFDTSNEFYALFVAYGLVNGTFNDYDYVKDREGGVSDKIATIAPFYFVRSGFGDGDPNIGGAAATNDAGAEGYYWSSTLAGDGACMQGEGNCAAVLRLRSDFIDPYEVYDHMNDTLATMRCIAR